jgi:hypothetical protein
MLGRKAAEQIGIIEGPKANLDVRIATQKRRQAACATRALVRCGLLQGWQSFAGCRGGSCCAGGVEVDDAGLIAAKAAIAGEPYC